VSTRHSPRQDVAAASIVFVLYSPRGRCQSDPGELEQAIPTGLDSPNADDASRSACQQITPIRRQRVAARWVLRRRKVTRLLIPLAVLAAFAVLFVGWEVVERRLFPEMSIGMRHALFTLRAVVVTIVASTIVYLLMRRQQRFLSETAGKLAQALESYQRVSGPPRGFENPYLVHCHEVWECQETECAARTRSGERCWQVMALRRSHADSSAPRVQIQRCRECDVYKLSCPDKLTELGESFNNLIFLLEEQSEQARQMLGQMVEKEKMVAAGQIAAGVAHEIGNPLSSISSVVQMLKRSKDKTRTAEQLDLIEKHIQRISAIVRQLANLSRPGEEKPEMADINQCVEQAVHLISFDHRARKVRVKFEPGRDLPHVPAFRGQLGQVFINLCLNALDAMPDGGELRLWTQRKDNKLLVHVKDTGIGIPPENGRRIFEPFFTTKDPGHGTGLGLAVSYGIVEKHGGTIDFHSTLGGGTTFVVELPIRNKLPDSSHEQEHRTSR
jgi:signal transduction histidine kinase